jgi:AcrR family transcriptional regulator
MRTHDSHVTDDGLTEAITGNPAKVDPATGSLTSGSRATGSRPTDPPVTGSPATGSPATDSPVTGSPATGSMTTGSPATGSPVTDSPVTGSPVTGSPATGSVTTGSPATGSPATVSPANDPVLAASAPNVRVPPWDAWCAVDTHDTGEILHAGDPKDVGDILEPGGVRDPARAADTATDAKECRDAVRRPGRPRSERAEHAIIDAAIEALGEHGIDGVRCEDVAARAGVGKATLYRRWAGKEDLLIAAFAAMKHPLPAPRGESTREDLISLLTAVAADADDPRFAQQYALLHGAGERYPRLVTRYKEQIIEPRRELVREVLRRGVQTGELRPDIHVEVAMLMLTGAVLARGKHDPAPAAPGFVESAVDEMLRGLAPR